MDYETKDTSRFKFRVQNLKSDSCIHTVTKKLHQKFG